MITVGKTYSSGRIAPVKCLDKDTLKEIDMQDKSFLLLLLTEGVATFQVGETEFTATAPCFVCFNEQQNPVLIKKRHLQSKSIYFHPQFLNINMTFDLIRSEYYGDIAHTHDMFLLKPFLENQYVVPITAGYLEKLIETYDQMQYNLDHQVDWYWSCRARSFFMEIIICLERHYGMVTRGELRVMGENSVGIQNERLKKAILFIESHYGDNLTLPDIVKAAKSNHTTLSALFSRELDMSPMEYVWEYRIQIAKKHLAFTEVPLKDVAARCGFKTVQHFNRMVKEKTGQTPAQFRRQAVADRIKNIRR